MPRKRRDPETPNTEIPEEADAVPIPMVPIGEGRYVPQVFKVTMSDERGLWTDLVVEMRGREAVCTALMLRRTDGAAIQKEDLRAFPLRERINAAVAGQAVSREAKPMIIPGKAEPVEMVVIPPEEGESLTAGLQGGRPRVTDDTLQEVARVYREAVATGEAPTAAVQRHMKRSRSTAGRLVMQARQRGFLGQAKSRMAGEVISQKTTSAKKRRRKS
jgi:hypothetical protein